MPDRPEARRRVWPTGLLALSLVGTLVFTWFSPWSPLAVERGDYLFARGDAQAAADHFDDVAAVHPMASVRARALRRAAAVWTLELGEPEEAKARWLALTELTDVPSAWAAHAWSSIGHLERVAFEDPAAAAAAFQQAVDIDADSPRAAGWLSDAARALSEDGQVDRAHQVWDTVARKYPAERALARIEQASLLFAKGQVAQAEELYQDAIVAAKSDHHLQVARLGANACRERLARVEEALAEIESDELDPELLELRRVQLSEGTQGPSDDL